MLDKLSTKYDQARQTFAGLTAGRKILILAGMAAVVAGFVVLLVWLNKPNYEAMYFRLSEKDAGAIVAKLKEKKIPFQLTPDGATIMVPRELLQETRLALATEGLPSSGTVGMELFNKVPLGTTDFVQRLNYQRALQGELERTISRFNEIERVRVHLNIPKESLFIEERREPSASVVVRLHPGRALSQSQMAGIVHLVSGSVEGLKPDNVSIVDTAGGLLYSKKVREAGGLMTAEQIQHRLDLERNLADRIQTMLYRVVGPEKALARVTAELNYQQITAHELVYDPDRTAVRSEQRLTDKGLGASTAAAGTPTTRYRLGTTPPQTGTGAGGGGSFDRTEETTNYEITRIDRDVVIPAGAVKRLSVAVIVDGTYTETEKEGK
ncbi:MAG: flagellar basal-body MS-ring/collar protein FliF, partial [Pseudomonadota bacterium]